MSDDSGNFIELAAELAEHPASNFPEDEEVLPVVREVLQDRLDSLESEEAGDYEERVEQRQAELRERIVESRDESSSREIEGLSDAERKQLELRDRITGGDD